MKALRDHLADQLDRKVKSHGLVVWDDPAGEYTGVWSSLVPPGVRSEAFDGSWYELRRRIENDVANEGPPKLVVYTPVRPPEEDPLAEVREAGTPFRAEAGDACQAEPWKATLRGEDRRDRKGGQDT